MAANFLQILMTNLLTPLLSPFTLVLLPIFAGLLILAPFFPNNTVQIRRYARGFYIFHLVYSLCFMLFINPNGTSFGFLEKLPFDIIPAAALGQDSLKSGITIAFGLDNLSALMCVFTSFIMLLALIASKSMITSKQRLFYSMMLLLGGFLTGIFAANDLFTFLIFWELEIIPAYFLISMWGGANAKKSAMKFVLFTFLGSILMFISTALIYAFAFDMNMLTDFDSLINRTVEIPLLVQLIAVIGFFAAFAVKMPVFPFHTWLADAHTEAPTPVSMVLAGIMLKTAVYGMIRINIQMFYEMFQIMAPTLIFLGAIGILWASCLAISQSDIKRTVSYSSIANMGIILIGLASFTEYGLNGAIYHSIAHGLISAGLFMGIGIIYLKFKTRKIGLLGEISKYAPKLCALFFIFCAASMTIPFTMGFSGEFMCFMGGFNSPLLDKTFFLSSLIQPAVLFGIFGVILSAIYILRLLHRTFFGLSEYKYGNSADFKEKDICTVHLSHHQSIVLTVLAIGIIIFGLYPMGILDKIGTFSTLNIETILANIF